MSRKFTIALLLVLALSSLVVVTALANTIYLPLVDNQATPTATATLTPTPTATPLPQTKIEITDFNPALNPINDYIELYNDSSNSVDMSGWWIKASTGEKYDFPSGFKLGDGDTVRVRSGGDSGMDTSTDLYWGLSSSVWLKALNCAYLKNADGVTISSACVPPVYIQGFNPSSVPANDYLTIKNNTTYALNMTGWWLKAETESGRYDFPSGFTLGALASVNVHSGSGVNSSSDLYIGLSSSLWTKSGNCAYLRYKDGTLLDKACVP